MPIPTAAPRQGAALPLFSTQAPDKVSGLFHAGTILARLLEMGRALDAKLLRGALEEAFGASDAEGAWVWRSEEHTSELQSLMRISYAVFCLKTKNSARRSTDRAL